MPEKEISLDATNTPQPAPDNPEQTKPESKENHQFDFVKADLSNKLTDESTPTDILGAILNAPEEDLLPWEEVTVPSRGLYYDGKIPGGVVKVRAMGLHADKILATARLAQTGQSIDYLLEHCVQLPNGYNPLDLLSGDRTFLLYLLRGITHGNNYEFVLKCPKCDASQTCQYDLNQLAKTMTIGNPQLREPVKVVLPYLSAVTGRETWITIRFLRGFDISKIANRQRFNKRVTGVAPGQRAKPTIDDTLTENLHLVVTSFMGDVTDPAKIRELISKLHSSDTATIRQFLKDSSPGIDTTITLQCVECDTEIKIDLPITESFFRPTNS